MATALNSNFDEVNDRFNTPAAKFKKEYLFDLFGTDDLYPFWIADQDFKSPPEILTAFHQKVDEGIFGYEYRTHDFKTNVIQWFKDRFTCDLQSEWMVFTPTIMSSIAIALDSFTQKKDQILIQPPVYKEFKSVIQKTQRTVVTSPLLMVDHKYQMDVDYLIETVNKSNISAMLICNPHNPGGRVWTKTELKQIVDICLENEIILISDEIHADIVFKPHSFTSLLSFPEIHNQLVVCYSPAKVFNIASISDSLCIIPNSKLKAQFELISNRYNLGRTNAFSQIAWSEGFGKSHDWVDALNIYIEDNVKYISNFISTHISQLQLIQQEGTYLVWIDASKLSLQGDSLIHFLGTEAKMGVNNGNVFGMEGKGFIRMNVSCPRSILVQAMNNFKEVIDKLS